jgi:hypothetical protein
VPIPNESETNRITKQLEDEGVDKFSSALTRLMGSLQEKQAAALALIPGKTGN